MDYSSLEFVKAKILFKLARRRNWGHSHTSFDNLKKGFKSNEADKVKKVSEQLMRENWLLAKPTHYGTEVSLNPKFSTEIKQFVKNVIGQIIE